MNTPRYIVKKPAAAQEDAHSTPFELVSDYFLTAQTTTPPDDFESGNFALVRYGIPNVFPQNYAVTDEPECGVPVHASCWEIFQRVSELRLGRVELQGLMELWEVCSLSSCSLRLGQCTEGR